MGTPPDFSFVSPILVGREAHLRALDALVEKVLIGKGQTLFLAGEAGVGKTRLMVEANGRTLPRAFAHVEGHAFVPDRAVPFAPPADLLHSYVSTRSSSRLAKDLGTYVSDLTRIYQAAHFPSHASSSAAACARAGAA